MERKERKEYYTEGNAESSPRLRVQDILKHGIRVQDKLDTLKHAGHALSNPFESKYPTGVLYSGESYMYVKEC